MIIGNFETNNGGGLFGRIALLGIGSVRLELKPNTQAARQEAGGPDLIVVMAEGGAEVGAAWRKTSKSGKAYISVQVDSPVFGAPVNLALFQRENGGYMMVWERRRPPGD